MKPPRWVADATDPSDGEVGEWLDGDVGALGSAATEPLDDEVRRLLSRPVPAPRRPVGVGPVVLVGVGLAAAGIAILVGGGAPVAPILWIPGPEIADVRFEADGPGDWSVVRRDREGAVVAQTAGTVLYRVAPLPDGATLRIEAGDLEVDVIGTVFEVGTNAGDAWVTVYEGKVALHDGDVDRFLVAGEAWERVPAVIVAPRPASTPTPTASPPSPDPAATFAELLRRYHVEEPGDDLRAALWSFAEANGDSPLAVEARAVALLVAARTQDPAAVASAIDAFLAANPTTPRQVDLWWAEAELRKDRLHDCERAMPIYRRVELAADGVVRARAEGQEGLCAAILGRPSAVPLLRGALADGVDGSLQDKVRTTVERLDAH